MSTESGNRDEQQFWAGIDDEVSERLATRFVEPEDLDAQTLSDLDRRALVFRLAGGEEVDAGGWLEHFQDHLVWQSAGQLRFGTRASFVAVSQARMALWATSQAGRQYHPQAFTQGAVSEADGVDGVVWEAVPRAGSQVGVTHWFWLDWSGTTPRLAGADSTVRRVCNFVSLMREQGFTGACLEFLVYREHVRPGRSVHTVAGREVWFDDPTKAERIDWGHWDRPDVDEQEFVTPLRRYRMFREEGAAAAERATLLSARRAIRTAAMVEEGFEVEASAGRADGDGSDIVG